VDGAAEEWIREHVEPTGSLEVVRDRIWARTARVPTSDGSLWFKALAPTHQFEVELAPLLATGWPDLVPHVVAAEMDRGWLLLADAGTSFDHLGNPPELWRSVLPGYAELQRDFSVPDSVPDRRLERWPELYDDLVGSDLPLTQPESTVLRRYAPRFAEQCAELASYGVPAAIQHDDLHHRNAYLDGEAIRIIDWGDASRSHPFASLVVTFRFLEERNGLAPADPPFAMLRDAYLEPWGTGLRDAFDLAQQLGRFAHAFGWIALRRLLAEDDRPTFNIPFQTVLRRALACV
jgi:Phosphotransferase enzyme family